MTTGFSNLLFEAIPADVSNLWKERDGEGSLSPGVGT